MIKRSLESIAATCFAGMLVLLPVALTLAVLAWVFSLVNRLVGPGTVIGRMFAALGYPVTGDPTLAYVFRGLVLLACIYRLGVGVQAGLQGHLRTLADRTVRRIPLVGDVYGVADRFVGLLDHQQEADSGAMSPVGLVFRGEGGAGVQTR